MSQMAQEFERRLREMRASGARRRPVMGDEVAKSVALGIEPEGVEQATVTVSTATVGGNVAKRKKAKKPTVAKKAGKKAAATAREPKWPLPPLDEMRLAPGGISAHGDRHIQFTFSTGIVVRLFPVNLNKKDTTTARDALVAWLKKRLAA